MNHDNEKELFKRAYLNLMAADSIPFPDAVFDEYVRLRDSEGYKLVPVDSLKEIIDCAYCHIYDRCVGNEGDDVIKHILAMGVEDDH